MPGARGCGVIAAWMGLTLAALAFPAGAERRVAIASIFPIADLVQRIGGERWEVLTLIPAGASAHTYEPVPEQVRALSQARVFFRVGLGLEFWLEKVVRAAQNPALLTVDLSEGIATLPGLAVEWPWTAPSRGHPHRHDASAAGQHAHVHAGADPHYWLDPVRMQQVATRIERVLSQIDPAQAAAYAERGEGVRQALQALHEEILQATQPLRQRRFIAMHSAWTYFAPRYGLEQVAVIEPFPGREPSPRYLAELAKLMRREGVKAVVIEPQLATTAAHALARETGARVAMLDPTGGPGVPGRDSYFALMRYNLTALVALLQEAR